MQYKSVLSFWFEDSTPEDWFKKNEQFDNKIKTLFLNMHDQVSKGETMPWRLTPLGALAEVIVLDQFSRNMFRNTAKAFAYDNLALALSQRAIEMGFDQQLNTDERKFLYMPFMHSESKIIHALAVKLFEALNDKATLQYEILHKQIIDQFGRYPHRNLILGRTSTPEEIEFLKQENSSF